MTKIKLGLALTGSYCSFSKLEAVLPRLCGEFDVVPIFSENAQRDSRFGEAARWMELLEQTSGHKAVTSIAEAEPLGPKGLMDVLAIVPCTGNTLAKLSRGVTDTAVTMAAKGHLRNGKPVARCLRGKTSTSCPSARMTRRPSPCPSAATTAAWLTR